MRSPRFWTVCVLLILTAVLLNTRGDADHVPASEPLSSMPENISGWTGRDFAIADDILAILGKGDFLSRNYTYTGGDSQPSTVDSSIKAQAPIGLFIGYFPTQRTGQSIHSPQNCLPGAGWTFESSHYVNLTGNDGKSYRVGEYVISDGSVRQFVIYWYQAHGRSVANEYLAKFYLIADAIRLDRTDGALIRITTVVPPGETIDQARQRAVSFTRNLVPMLPRFIPN